MALPPGQVKNSGNTITSCIDYAGLINRDEWLILGWAYHPVETDLKLEFPAADQDDPGDVILIRGMRPDVCIHHGDSDLGKRPGFAIIARINRKGQPYNKTGARLVLQLGNDRVEHRLDRPGPVDPAAAAQPLQTFTAAQRAQVYLEIFERADPLFISQLSGQPRHGCDRIHIDNAIALPGGYFVNGWFDNSQDELVGVYLLAGSRLSGNLLDDLSRYHRTDIVDTFDHVPASYSAGGFAYVPVQTESRGDQVDVITLADNGDVTRNSIKLTWPRENEVGLTQTLLGNIDICSPDIGEIFARHIDPALHGLWQQRLSTDKAADVLEFGNPPADPKRTLVVPVYGRYDLVMYQLAQFASDPDFRESDLLYVLDDPGIRHDLLRLCEDWQRIFGVPFRVVTRGQNQGFACANNLGAQHARSDMLLLMNSDVIPREPGWLGKLQARYESLENPGAVGVRLVYDDGTIQHDGMAFIQSPEYPGIWLNDHPNKGMPPWLADEPGVRELPAVTAACMMIARDRYEEAGGLDPSYILGDFEDSDLCLKLREKGYRNYLVSTVQIYHLERLSQNLVDPGDWKHKLTLFNAWQHTRRWGDTINTLNGSRS